MYNRINIVLPVYNEGENIEAVLQEIREKIHVPCNKLIIYDFEEDNTIPVVKAIMKNDKDIRLIRNNYGGGVLNAIKTGFENIDKGAVLVSMADLSDDYSNIDLMFKKINEGYDIVCGSRYIKGGRQIGGPRFKGLLSRLAGISLHYFTGIPTHDITNSLKMYTKRVLNNIKIESDGGFELGMEVVVKAFFAGYKVAEVPSIWRDRRAGKSRFKLWKWLPKYLYWYYYAVINSLRGLAKRASQ